MRPAQQFIEEADVKRIESEVAAAESKTSGEIVPILATAADPYDRGLFFSAMMGAIAATLLVFAIYLFPLPWLTVPAWYAPFIVLVPAQTLGFFGGYYLARSNPNLHRAFVSRAWMQLRVKRAAEEAFWRFHITKTQDATGIMIFVSIFERMVVVLADKAINEKHDQATWDEVRNLLVEGLKADKPGDGFNAAIKRCGEILAVDFPIQPGDINELSNHLRILN